MKEYSCEIPEPKYWSFFAYLFFEGKKPSDCFSPKYVIFHFWWLSVQNYSWNLFVPSWCGRDRTVPTASSFQGTLIMANVDSALFDPAYWETPHQFNPGHFLDKGGNFVTQEAFLAFSAGEWTENWAQLCGIDEAVLFSLWKGQRECNPKLQEHKVFPAQKNVWLQKKVVWQLYKHLILGFCENAEKINYLGTWVLTLLPLVLLCICWVMPLQWMFCGRLLWWSWLILYK